MSQHQTYGGMLNGLPSEPEEKVLQAVADANEWDCNFHKRPAVLPAAIVSGTRIAPEGQVHRDRWIEPKKWEMLPVVTCFGVFESSQRQGGFEDFSSSLVIWFQGHFGIPADAGTLVAFSLLDWDRHAEECNW
ncbi:MAG: hypothetical protein ING75_03690 [Rhodocyclaceae bacterium]|nr:hypothetical protein [Rhodocyclaceae bacterium]